MTTRNLIAAFVMPIIAALAANAQTPAQGPGLPISNITVREGEVRLAWDDYSGITGLRVYTTDSLENKPIQWEILADFPLDTTGCVAPVDGAKRFYKLHAVKGEGCPCGCDCHGNGGGAKPPWTFPPGTGGGTDANGPFVVVAGPDHVFGTGDDVYVRPATPADVDNETGIVIVPENGAVISVNDKPVIIDNISPDGHFPEGTLVLPDGTIIVPGPNADGTPAINPDGSIDVGEGDIIILPPYDKPYIVPAPGGTYRPDIPGVVINDDPLTYIRLPDGLTVIEGNPPAIVLPGADGEYGTDDDVVVAPATPADVDPGTGIVTIPEGGAAVGTNGVPIVIEGVTDNEGNFPEGTLVLPDGTIIVPGPNADGTPKINDDGTIEVGGGDLIINPPYDAPFEVPHPGGTYDPDAPELVLGTVPPTVIPFPVRQVLVDFDANGGDPFRSATRKCIVGQAYGELPAVSRQGEFEFTGWFTAKDGGNEIFAESLVEIARNHTLFAHWKSTKVDVSKVQNGEILVLDGIEWIKVREGGLPGKAKDEFALLMLKDTLGKTAYADSNYDGEYDAQKTTVGKLVANWYASLNAPVLKAGAWSCQIGASPYESWPNPTQNAGNNYAFIPRVVDIANLPQNLRAAEGEYWTSTKSKFNDSYIGYQRVIAADGSYNTSSPTLGMKGTSSLALARPVVWYKQK